MLRAFLTAEQPALGSAVSALRLVFAVMFLSQAVIAGMVAAMIMLIAGPQLAGRSTLGAVLVALSLLQLALGTILPDALCRSGTKGSVLASTLLAGVLLATPGWFLMLALVTGQGLPSLAALTAALTLGYGVGFVLTGRFAARTVALAGGSNGDG